MPMDINQLRTLIQVAELGSLSKASDRLCIAQPALSRRLSMLEDELGTRLFERHGRGMVLTNQGQRVLFHARKIMAEMEDIRISLADETLKGHVAIGLPPSVAEVLSAPLVNAIQSTHPNITCRLFSGYSLELLERIQSGDLDVAILYDPLYTRSLKSTAFLEEELFVVGSTNMNFSLDTPVSLIDLSHHKWLLPSSRHSLRQIADMAAKKQQVELRMAFEVDAYDILKKFLAAGLGISMLPLSAIREELDAGHYSAAPIIDPTPRRRLELVFPTDRQISQITNYVGEEILDTSQWLISQGIWQARMLNRSEPESPPS